MVEQDNTNFTRATACAPAREPRPDPDRYRLVSMSLVSPLSSPVSRLSSLVSPLSTTHVCSVCCAVCGLVWCVVRCAGSCLVWSVFCLLFVFGLSSLVACLVSCSLPPPPSQRTVATLVEWEAIVWRAFLQVTARTCTLRQSAGSLRRLKLPARSSSVAPHSWQDSAQVTFLARLHKECGVCRMGVPDGCARCC